MLDENPASEMSAFLSTFDPDVQFFQMGQSSDEWQKIADFGSDIFIICTYSPKKLQTFIKRNARRFDGRPKLALTCATSPNIRAGLFNNGFDGVFDINTDSYDLLLSNLIAIQRRYDFSNKFALGFFRAPDSVQSVAYIDQLNRRQVLILKALLDSSDKSASAEELKKVLSVTGTPISDNQLKVLMTQTRKRLRPGFQIINSFRLGNRRGYYQLIDCEGSLNS